MVISKAGLAVWQRVQSQRPQHSKDLQKALPISFFPSLFFAGLCDIDRLILEIKTKEGKPRYLRERKLRL